MSAPDAAAAETFADNAALFEELDAYPWDQDSEFQAGLTAILGPSPSPSQIVPLTIRARCFYYSRKKKIPVDFDAYKAHVLAPQLSTNGIATGASASSAPSAVVPALNGEEPASAPTTDAPQQPQYPTTFAEIVQLITTGAPIPGIKEIPPTVLKKEATAATASKRRKPWESDEVSPEPVEGTFGDARDRVIIQEEPPEDGDVEVPAS